MKILIAGDLVPTKENINLFNNGDVESLLGRELLLLWNSADLKMFNLETPLTNFLNPISKCGPNLSAPISSISGIKALNPSIIALANNHILDQGIDGLNSTMSILSQNNIPFLGVGKHIKEAKKHYIIKKNNMRIGIYNCAEHEFSIATSKLAGANPFDPLESLDHINNLKKECDYLIVIYHAGKEHYRYPSPYLQKSCRKMVEKGANLVVCQHSHCIGAFENYNSSTIVYGQGNFIFDHSESEYWKTSILVDIEIDKNIEVKYQAIVKTNNTIRLANETEKEKIIKEFYKRSENIQNEDFIEYEYLKKADESLRGYLRKLSVVNKWFDRIDRYLFKGKLLKYRYNYKRLLEIQNSIECEAHRELLLKGIKGEIGLE